MRAIFYIFKEYSDRVEIAGETKDYIVEMIDEVLAPIEKPIYKKGGRKKSVKFCRVKVNDRARIIGGVYLVREKDLLTSDFFKSFVATNYIGIRTEEDRPFLRDIHDAELIESLSDKFIVVTYKEWFSGSNPDRLSTCYKAYTREEYAENEAQIKKRIESNNQEEIQRFTEAQTKETHKPRRPNITLYS